MWYALNSSLIDGGMSPFNWLDERSLNMKCKYTFDWLLIGMLRLFEASWDFLGLFRLFVPQHDQFMSVLQINQHTNIPSNSCLRWIRGWVHSMRYLKDLYILFIMTQSITYFKTYKWSTLCNSPMEAGMDPFSWLWSRYLWQDVQLQWYCHQ